MPPKPRAPRFITVRFADDWRKEDQVLLHVGDGESWKDVHVYQLVPVPSPMVAKPRKAAKRKRKAARK